MSRPRVAAGADSAMKMGAVTIDRPPCETRPGTKAIEPAGDDLVSRRQLHRQDLAGGAEPVLQPSDVDGLDGAVVDGRHGRR